MPIYRPRVLEIVQAGLEESISFLEFKMRKETSQISAALFIVLPVCGQILFYPCICRGEQQFQNASHSHNIKMLGNFHLTVLFFQIVQNK